MNQKELNEIRRRIAPNKCGISKLYGCFVNNSSKEIISRIDTSLGLLSEFENEKYLSLLKKVLSGGLGKNLIDIVFSTQQVMKGEEHKLLSDLRKTGLNDPGLREEFFQKVIQAVTMEDTNYLILLAYDAYDVPYKGKDDETQADASDTVYSYLLCSVCPVKDGKPELAYFPGENQFHSSGISHIVSAPALGFLFPAFDDRAANIYNALYYAKDPNELHQTFLDTVFHTEPPMSAGKQKETFHSVLSDALDEDCSFDVLQQVHEQIREVILDHKESKDPNPLELSPQDLGTILKGGGVPGERVQAFQRKCAQEFGPDAPLKPGNLIDSKKFTIETPQVKISVDPEASYLVETRVIGGRKYILIPADDGVEVNGIPVQFAEAKE
ncbi:MAG: DUF4317 domain-containing protein [Ruminiclostridium sp.]|nr:DUF4317 domain-containing protein [Ruminiclostridium sp.]